MPTSVAAAWTPLLADQVPLATRSALRLNSPAIEANMHEQSADTHCDVLVMSADTWTVDQVQNIAGKMLSVHAQEGTCLASQ